jgi:hypothetical protein
MIITYNECPPTETLYTEIYLNRTIQLRFTKKIIYYVQGSNSAYSDAISMTMLYNE